MTNRLLAIANLINNKDKKEISVIDVGSDHAYLSIYLINNKIATKVTNIEVNKKPLENGYENVKRHNLLSQIDFVLNDGFKDLNLNREVDYITISGMGATSIINIIENNKHQIPSCYVVQPNNDIDKLRKYLQNHNYIIDTELVINDMGVYYEILKFHLDKQTNILTDLDLFVGPINKLNKNDPVLHNYLSMRVRNIERFDVTKINANLFNEYQILKEFLKC